MAVLILEFPTATSRLVFLVAFILLLCNSINAVVGFTTVTGQFARISISTCHAIIPSESSSMKGDDQCRKNIEKQHHHYHHHHPTDPSFSSNTNVRRQLLTTIGKGLVSGLSMSSILTSSTLLANANGLLQFPCIEPLKNIYHLMRAGTNLLEEVDDIWSTNPLFLTNREAALSVGGVQQTLHAADLLQQEGIQPSVVKHSLAASSMDAANIIRDELKIGQNRIVPEFVFMDPRAIGKWDMMSYQQTYPAIVALDELEAGIEGRDGRPPPTDDGTPHETLFEQATRLRQLMSAMETQYSGDTVLLVFPDATGPALLSAMIAGVPFNQVHLLDYQPGELRMDVTMSSTLRLLETKQSDRALMDSYAKTVHIGQTELNRLRSLDESKMVSKRDEQIEQERISMDEDQRIKAVARRVHDEEVQEARVQRQREVEERRQVQNRRDVFAGNTEGRAANSLYGSSTGDIGGTVLSSLVMGGGVITLIGVPMVGTGNKDEMDGERSMLLSMNVTDQAAGSTTFGASPSMAVTLPSSVGTNSNFNPITTLSTSTATAAASTMSAPTFTRESSPSSSLYGNFPSDPSRSSMPGSFNTPVVVREEDRIMAATNAMDEYMNRDDGADDWLRVLGDITVEDDDDDIIMIGE
jgi:broad specificity phosphatase PhoE